MKLAWLTDLHLNFVPDRERIRDLVRQLRSTGAEAFLIGGDTAEAPDFCDYLTVLAEGVGASIYFVLGNHDYYRSDVVSVRNDAKQASDRHERLHWLPECGVVQLTPQTTLVGHGGWGDGRAGSFLESDVVLNDYFLINDLQQQHGFPDDDLVLTPALLSKLQELGNQAAAHLQNVVPRALRSSEHVIVLMHVPPFLEACWHEGRISDDNWSPHFVCQAAGESLEQIMQNHPQKRMTVLCGHTHSSGKAMVLDNLEVLTGGATYREPEIQPLMVVQ